MERLTERELSIKGTVGYNECYFTKCNAGCSECEVQEKVALKLKEYEDAEEQGLLRKLPCKCGDVLWGIKVYKGYLMAKQGTVREMFFTKDMTLLVVLEHICRSEFGKKIFRTKAETEQAILDMGYVRDEKNPSLFRVKKGE